MTLFIVEFESAHWAGAPSHCVVEANSAEEAEDLEILHGYMQEYMEELYSGEYDDELENDNDLLTDEPSYSLNFIKELFGSEFMEYYKDPEQQRVYYPLLQT